MKWSEYFIPTLKENPAEAVIASHQLMIRAGMIRKTGSGLYSYLPYGLKILKTVENIVREEMDKAGALEIAMPLLIHKKLLDRSGRWEIFQKELFRLKDRHDTEMALSPTNEENFTDLVKQELSSYRKFPINLYQINDKFRDEIRPRYGVMRGKEFIMKDSYSFDLTDESLDISYQKMKQAYINIFTRVGLDFIPVEADSGAMGGSGSEEFMVKSQVGEETIVLCDCGYVANMETADETLETNQTASGANDISVKEVLTPDQDTIQKVCEFLNTDIKHSIKTRVYERVSLVDNKIPPLPLVVVIRGDYEVNEVKLQKLFPDDELRLANLKTIERVFQCSPGYLGVKGLSSEIDLVVDETLKGLTDGVMGANKEGYHLIGVDVVRDVFGVRKNDFKNIYLAKETGRCPKDGNPLKSFKGIEVGHIFKLGRKYSEAFDIKIVNEQGEKVVPTMGCYGIGINRVFAAMVEHSYDENGIILPYEVAPFKVVIISLNVDKELVKKESESIYQEFSKEQFSPLWDDRDERAGAKFGDADLIGIPVQVIVGEKGLKEDQIEIRFRKANQSLKKTTSRADLLQVIRDEVKTLI